MKAVTCLCAVLASYAAQASPLYMVEYVIHGTGVARTPPAEGGFYSSTVEDGEIPGKSGGPGTPVVRVEDDLAVFEWRVTDMSVQVRITNRSNRGGDSTPKRLIVLLDLAEYVDRDGGGHDLVRPYHHSSRVIAPGKSRIYVLFPRDYSVQRRALFGRPIRGRVVERPEEILDLYKDHVGQSFRMRLPIRVKELAKPLRGLDEVVYEYEFDMTVSKVQPRLVPKGS